jgi:sugar lactone lactonase YvrE
MMFASTLDHLSQRESINALISISDRADNHFSSGKGVAYITDSSAEGRNALIVVDLGTGQSWRHLDLHPSVMPDEGLMTSYNNQAFLPISPLTGMYSQFTYGVNGMALSSDGEWLYYTALASRVWYRVPTSLLRVPSTGVGMNAMAAWRVRRNVQLMGRNPSHAAGFEADTTGAIYLTAPEANAIYKFDPNTMQNEVYVQDGLIQWPDTLSVAQDGRMYMTVNQLWM